MTATPKFTPEVVRAAAEMAVNSPDQFELVKVAFPADVLESISETVLVIESEKAATLIEKFLLPESERGETFADDVASLITKSNDVAGLLRSTIALRSTQGAGDSMARKVQFPTRYGVVTITLK